jgi:CheY-like chemotaxis protein
MREAGIRWATAARLAAAPVSRRATHCLIRMPETAAAALANATLGRSRGREKAVHAVELQRSFFAEADPSGRAPARRHLPCILAALPSDPRDLDTHHKKIPMTSNAFGLPPGIAELLRSSRPNGPARSEAARRQETAAGLVGPPPPSPTNTAAPDNRPPAASRVMIVDGDEEAVELLSTLLRLSDPAIATMAAHTAHAALLLASRYHPDVAIIDLGTQAMSGEAIAGGVLAVCAEARPLMIALSGGGFGKREARLRKVFDHVLTKPVELANLVSLVTRRPALVQSRRS